MTELYGKGLLNHDASPDAWRLIPAAKLDLLEELINPLEAALAHFVLSPAGIGDVLIEVGLLQS
jgi:hypothetical protein